MFRYFSGIRHSRTRFRAVACLASIVVAAGALVATGFAAQPQARGAVAPSTFVYCTGGGNLPFRWGAIFKRPRDAEDGRTAAAAALRRYIRGELFLEERLPRRGWFELGRAQGFGGRRYIEFGVGRLTNLSTVTFERRGRGPWSFYGSSYFGRCLPRVISAEGTATVGWYVDPARMPLDPNDSVLHLLVYEPACASGMPADGRVKVTSLQQTDASVELALEIKPQRGTFSCQGNPPTYVDVPLQQPIGDRALIDVGAVPTDSKLSTQQLLAIRSGASIAEELLFDKSDREFCRDRFLDFESRELLRPSADQRRRFDARSRRCERT